MKCLVVSGDCTDLLRAELSSRLRKEARAPVVNVNVVMVGFESAQDNNTR
jgi:hypothetical protein